MRKLTFRSLFAGFGTRARRSAEQKLVTVPESKRLLSEEPTEEPQPDEVAEQRAEDVPEEMDSDRATYPLVSNERESPPLHDSSSISSSSLPTHASSKALSKGRTFDQSDAGSFSLPSWERKDLFDPTDVYSILESEASPSFMRPQRRSSMTTDDSYSIAASSSFATTKTSTSMFLKTHTFDFTGTSLLGMDRETSESSVDVMGASFAVQSTMNESSEVSYSNAELAHAFSHDLHTFLKSVFNIEKTESED
jgi:hypothetical protein